MKLDGVRPTTRNCSEIFGNIMQDYEQSKELPGQKLKTFIFDQILKHEIFESQNEAEAAASDIIRTIESIDSNFKEIQKRREQGHDITNWVIDRLNIVVEKHPFIEKNSFLNEIKEGLMTANNQLFGALFRDKRRISTPFESSNFDGLNKRAMASDLLKDSENNALLTMAAMHTDVSAIVGNESIRTTMKEFFVSPLNSDNEISAKAAIATAVLIAAKKEWISPGYSNISPVMAAAIADRSASSAKVAFKVASGESTTIDAINYIVDRAAATMITIVDENCEKVGEKVGGAVGSMVGVVFGPTGASIGQMVGQTIGAMAGRVIGDKIIKGIEKCTEVVKEKVGKVMDCVYSNVSSAWNKLTSWF